MNGGENQMEEGTEGRRDGGTEGGDMGGGECGIGGECGSVACGGGAAFCHILLHYSQVFIFTMFTIETGLGWGGGVRSAKSPRAGRGVRFAGLPRAWGRGEFVLQYRTSAGRGEFVLWNRSVSGGGGVRFAGLPRAWGGGSSFCGIARARRGRTDGDGAISGVRVGRRTAGRWEERSCGWHIADPLIELAQYMGI